IRDFHVTGVQRVLFRSLFEVEPERTETECGEHPIEIVPTSTRYPNCVAGHVERVETTIGEGEEAITLPARPPYLGVCCTPGCRQIGRATCRARGNDPSV